MTEYLQKYNGDRDEATLDRLHRAQIDGYYPKRGRPGDDISLRSVVARVAAGGHAKSGTRRGDQLVAFALPD